MSKKCGKCNTCTYFGSKFTCNCTEPFDDHVTVIETREERVKAGKIVDPLWMGNNMNAAIGGLNSFTGMVNDKYMQQYQNLLSGEAMEGNMLSELKKNYLMDDNNNQESSSIKGNKINETKGESAYDLFKKPHIFSSISGMISKQMNRLSLMK